MKSKHISVLPFSNNHEERVSKSTQEKNSGSDRKRDTKWKIAANRKKSKVLYVHSKSWSRVFKDSFVHVLKLIGFSSISSLSVFILCLLIQLNSDLYVQNRSASLSIFGSICFFPPYCLFWIISIYNNSIQHLHESNGEAVNFGQFWKKSQSIMFALLVWGLWVTAGVPYFLHYFLDINVIKWKIHIVLVFIAFSGAYLAMFYLKLRFTRETLEGKAKIMERQASGKKELNPLHLILRNGEVSLCMLGWIFGYIIVTSYYFFEQKSPVTQIVFIIVSFLLKSLVQYTVRQKIISQKWPIVDIQCLFYATTILFDTQIRILISRMPSSGNIVLLSLILGIAEIIKRCSSSYLYIYSFKKKSRRVIELSDASPNAYQMTKSNIGKRHFCTDKQPTNKKIIRVVHNQKRRPITSIVKLFAIERGADGLAEYMTILASAAPAFMLKNSPNFSVELNQSLNHVLGSILLIQVGLELIVDYVSTCIELKQGFPVLITWDVSLWDTLINLSIPGYANIFIFFMVTLKA